jgi:hypothetical protein
MWPIPRNEANAAARAWALLKLYSQCGGLTQWSRVRFPALPIPRNEANAAALAWALLKLHSQCGGANPVALGSIPGVTKFSA